ncbi:MAG: ATPase [Saprospiraceae bacterium]|nr:ATPase [Saprospiraceae bacterium]
MKKLVKIIDALRLGLSIGGIGLVIFDDGWQGDLTLVRNVWLYYGVLFLCTSATITASLFFRFRCNQRLRKGDFTMSLLFLILGICSLAEGRNSVFLSGVSTVFALIYFLVEISRISLSIQRRTFRPAKLFVLSFMFLIVAGTMLLMLPGATVGGISFVDALFTATSAVTVTGLAVLDTGKIFTLFGQFVILFLVQAGGLGIMTFTSFLGFFFKGRTSIQEQMRIQDITNVNLGSARNFIIQVVLFTLAVEGAGALLIFLFSPGSLFGSSFDRAFFSVFHSVCAFCNAGFSTMTNNLYELPFRYNYSVQLVVALLLVIGGLGYGLIFNGFSYLYYNAKRFFARLIFNKNYERRLWLLNLNSIIVIRTTLILIVVGMVGFLVFEFNHALVEHTSWYGKLVTSFFASVTPRTAGFNTVNMATLTVPSLMICLLLMWIGASPGSTGGGIKTTTFAIATMNIFAIARNKDRLEIKNREISDLSIRRAFATICLSLIAVGFSVFFISFFEQDKSLMSIAVEAFSAYSTVGLSVGITPSLSVESKYVLIVTMFAGRVSTMMILIAIFRQVSSLPYRYPKEDILIN